MFNDKDAYNIAKIYEQIENELIADMMKNLSRHRAEETAEGYDWEQWQVLQLQALEEYKRKNLAKYKPKSLSNRIRKAITNANNVGGADAEKKILNMIKRGANITRQGSDNFFHVNENRVNALIDAVNNDLTKAEYALLRKADDEYRKIIYKTQVQASTGTITYEKAVDLATKDFLTRGIQCIQYKNGAMHQISSYAEMAMRTSMKRAYMQGEGAKREEWGVHTVIVNHRNHACSKCLPFVGKVLVDDVYSGGSVFEAMQMNLPTLSSAMQAGLFHPNCKDGTSTYFDGITEKPKPMTEQEKAYAEAYETLENDANGAYRRMQGFERLAQYALDPRDQKMYLGKYAEWKAKYESMRGMERSIPPVLNSTIPTIKRPYIRKEVPIEMFKKLANAKKIGALDIDVSSYSRDIGTIKNADISFEIPWDELPDRHKRRIRRAGEGDKPVQISKEDLIGRMVYMDKPLLEQTGNWNPNADRWLAVAQEDGYKFYGLTSVEKCNSVIDMYLLEKDGTMYAVAEEGKIDKTVSAKMVKALKAKQDDIADDLIKKNVNMADLTYRQGDEWVKAMQEFHETVEADLPVSWVTEEEYDAIQSPPLLRGFADGSSLRVDISTNGMNTTQMAEQLVMGSTGDCFPSRGVYGDCIAYMTENEKLAYDYATNASRTNNGFIAEVKLKPDARAITYEDAKELFEALSNTELTDDGQPFFSPNQRRLTNNVEVGKAMQLLGYDYIIEPNGDGLGIPFYMILNRDALVACPTRWMRNNNVKIGWKNYDKQHWH